MWPVCHRPLSVGLTCIFIEDLRKNILNLSQESGGWNYVKVKWSRHRPGVAQRVGIGIALLFHDRGTRRGWVVSSTPRPHFTPGKEPVPILQEAGWAPGPVWTGGESRPHRDSIPDRPARSSVTMPTELPDPRWNYVPLIIIEICYRFVKRLGLSLVVCKFHFVCLIHLRVTKLFFTFTSLQVRGGGSWWILCDTFSEENFSFLK